MVIPCSITYDAIDQNCTRRKITLGWALLNTSLASSPLNHDNNFENIKKKELDDDGGDADYCGDGDGDDDDDGDIPGESVVLSLSLQRPLRARDVLINLTIHNQYYHHIYLPRATNI